MPPRHMRRRVADDVYARLMPRRRGRAGYATQREAGDDARRYGFTRVKRSRFIYGKRRRHTDTRADTRAVTASFTMPTIRCLLLRARTARDMLFAVIAACYYDYLRVMPYRHSFRHAACRAARHIAATSVYACFIHTLFRLLSAMPARSTLSPTCYHRLFTMPLTAAFSLRCLIR